MQNDKLKAELFTHLSAELQAEGATELNTELVEADAIPLVPGRFSKLLRKIGGKFVTLVGKWVGLAFILYVTWVQSVPERTPIYVPSDGKAVVTTTPNTDSLVNLYQVDPSGSADLWISAYGLNRPVPPPKQQAQYIPCAGDKILYIPTGSKPPLNYIQTVTGSFAG